MKLIREELLETRAVIEEANGEKFLCIEGPFLEAGVKNRNGRWYKPEIMEREVNRYMQEKVQRGTSWGELGHPNGPGINLDRISHLTTRLIREGNSWIGRARLVDTVPGNTAKKLMEAGGTLGVSSRGLGSLKMDELAGYQVVQDDFHLAVAADIVADPSAPNAFVRGIMEGVDFFYDTVHGTWAAKALEPMREQLVRSNLREIDERKTEMFENFLTRLFTKTRAVEPASSASSGESASSLHSTLRTHGFNHVRSTDRGNGSLHAYSAGHGASVNGLMRTLKRKHGFSAARSDAPPRASLLRGRGGASHSALMNSKGIAWEHPDGSAVIHRTDGALLHWQPHRNEEVIFETDMSQIALARRAGVTPSAVREAWASAKRINESAGGEPDDFDRISDLTFRLLGLV